MHVLTLLGDVYTPQFYFSQRLAIIIDALVLKIEHVATLVLKMAARGLDDFEDEYCSDKSGGDVYSEFGSTSSTLLAVAVSPVPC